MILILSLSNSEESRGNAIYTQGGHKLRFFRSGKAQFVTVGIIHYRLKQNHRLGLAVIPCIGRGAEI